jgi:hypothetical protein
MQIFRRRLVSLVCTIALVAGAVHLRAQAQLTQQDAARFQTKLAVIEKNGVTAQGDGRADDPGD